MTTKMTTKTDDKMNTLARGELVDAASAGRTSSVWSAVGGELLAEVIQDRAAPLTVEKLETMTKAELVDAAEASGFRRADARRMRRSDLMEYLTATIGGRTSYVGGADR